MPQLQVQTKMPFKNMHSLRSRLTAADHLESTLDHNSQNGPSNSHPEGILFQILLMYGSFDQKQLWGCVPSHQG